VFLSAHQILERIRQGDLVIDPLLSEEQVISFAVYLRLGTDFVRNRGTQIGPLPDPVRNVGEVETVELGGSLVLDPGSTLLASSLEYVGLPQDLGGLLLPRASLQRAGLHSNMSSVDPGFQGKLLLSFFNGGRDPVVFSPGIRIARLSFFRLEVSEQSAAGLFALDSGAEIEALSEKLAAEHRDLQSISVSGTNLRSMLERVDTASGPDKGKALEDFAAAFIETINGLKIIKRNARLSAEELDIYLENYIEHGFWRFAGSPMIVECKNWAQPVGAREVTILQGKLESISPDAKTAILIAPQSVSGDTYKDAVLKIRESRQRGKQIIVLERDDLEAIAAGKHAARVIEEKYQKMLLT
jgi:dCTP deaminase